MLSFAHLEHLFRKNENDSCYLDVMINSVCRGFFFLSGNFMIFMKEDRSKRFHNKKFLLK